MPIEFRRRPARWARRRGQRLVAAGAAYLVLERAGGRNLRKAGVQEFPPEFALGHDAAERVLGSALASLLHGRTFEALCWFPRLNAAFRFDVDGDVAWTARHDVSDTGSSRIVGDDLCLTLPVITRGREACFAVFKVTGNNHLTQGYDYALAGPSLCYFREGG